MINICRLLLTRFKNNSLKTYSGSFTECDARTQTQSIKTSVHNGQSELYKEYLGSARNDPRHRVRGLKPLGHNNFLVRPSTKDLKKSWSRPLTYTSPHRIFVFSREEQLQSGDRNGRVRVHRQPDSELHRHDPQGSQALPRHRGKAGKGNAGSQQEQHRAWIPDHLKGSPERGFLFAHN